MPRNGSGTYVPPNNSWNPQITGALATPADFAAQLADLSNALSQSVSADGQTPIVGNIPMGGNKLTGLGLGTGTGDSVSWEQLFSQGVEQTIASAATVDIGAQNTTFLNITGTTTITSFGTNYNGPRYLRFASNVQITNSATLITWSRKNIFTKAGTIVLVYPKATGGIPDGWLVLPISSDAFPDAFQKNKIRNPLFNINQRSVSGTVTLAAGAYGHDGWKAGSGGCTYTFSTANGVTTINISAGSLLQIIEGSFITTQIASEQYVMSWLGTAQCRVNGGSYNSLPFAVNLPGATNVTVEFNTGTFWVPQLEAGITVSSFEYRSPSYELNLCLRYLRAVTDYPSGVCNSAGGDIVISFQVPMRTNPTFFYINSGGFVDGFTSYGISSPVLLQSSTGGAHIAVTAVGTTAGRGMAFNSFNAYFVAEL